ncbi:type VII secretion system-associated protein [Streptomyces sp. NPDC001177]
MSDERDRATPVTRAAGDADGGVAHSDASIIPPEQAAGWAPSAASAPAPKAAMGASHGGGAPAGDGEGDQPDEDQGPLWQPVSSPEDVPEPPEEIVQAARLAPDHYFYLPDPHWKGAGVPPAWAVIGRWRSDEKGEIAGWEDNRDYQPSAEALGWNEPADEIDAAVQAAVTGYGPAGGVASALATAHLQVFLDDEGKAARSEMSDGNTAIAVFTMAPSLQDADLPPHRHATVPELIDELQDDEQLLYLSPTSPVSIAVPSEVLRQVLSERQPGQTADQGGTAAGRPRATDEAATHEPGEQTAGQQPQESSAATGKDLVVPPPVPIAGAGLVGDFPWEAGTEADAAAVGSALTGPESASRPRPAGEGG